MREVLIARLAAARIILIQLRPEEAGAWKMKDGARAVWGSQWAGHMTGGWWGMGLFMGLFWLVLLGICVAAILAVVRGRTSGTGGESPRNSARRILEERYARGEISKQEFEEKKRDLGS